MGLLDKVFRDNRTEVMVVDDESDIRKLLSIHLEHLNLKVSQAGNAEEALDLIEDGHNPKLFILDVNMPGENGIALARKLCENRRFAKRPIIILTAVLTNEGLMRLESQMPNVIGITKPFDSREIKRMVEDLLKLPEKKVNAGQ